MLQVVGQDDLGNDGAMLTRGLVIAAAAPVAPRAPAPAALTVLTRAGLPLTIRVSAIAPTVDLAQIRATGMRVEVIPAGGTQLIRARIYRAAGGRRNGGRIASSSSAVPRRGRPLVEVFKAAPRKRGKVRLTHKDLRRLRVGRYVVEIAPATSRKRVGKTVTRRFRITG